MYRGKYEKPTPPGYRGVAFAPDKSEEEDQKSTPTPLENGAGDEGKTNSFLHPQPHYERSADRRNEVKRSPREFTYTQDTPSQRASAKSEEDITALLKTLLQKKISLEELLFAGVALVLALKDEDSDDLSLWAAVLMLLGGN